MSEARDQESPAPQAGQAGAPPPAAQPARKFRREALDYHSGSQGGGRLIELTPTWVRRTYWLLVTVCISALVYAVLGHVREYANGTVIVLSEDYTEVTAHAAGTIGAIAVRPGQRVTAGQVLVRLYAESEAADLARIEREIELHLIEVLREPGDQAARAQLAGLRAQRELALARLEERVVHAPQAGVVSDVHIRPGQRVDPGDAVLSLASDEVGFRVLAVLPGQFRPLLRRGMPMRLELMGFPYAYQNVVITAVSDEVVGPTTIRRYLPPAIAEVIETKGPNILVEARLTSRSFEVGGRNLEFYDGMLARAEVAVNSESILLTLVPGLRALTGEDGSGI